MIKKLLSFFCAFITIVSINVFPKNTYQPMSQSIKSGFGIGVNFATYQLPDYALVLTYDNKIMTASFGGNYENIKDPSGIKIRFFEWRYHLGLRYLLADKLFFSSGITGVFHTGDASELYVIGVYTGLDYYLLKRLFVSFKILPYAYSKDPVSFPYTQKRTSLFEHGSIALTYAF